MPHLVIAIPLRIMLVRMKLWREEPVLNLPALEDEPKHTVPDIPDFPLGTYVVSIQRRGTFKRLHCIGACPRRPGRDYACFEDLGMERPDADAYSTLCKHCFGRAAEVPISSSEGSSSSSSES